MGKSKLTKWSDIVYYYKWHAIGVVVLIVVAVMIITGIVNKVEDDITVNMLLSYDAMPTAGERLAADMNNVIPDINGDGIKQTYVNMVTIPQEIRDEADMNAGVQASVVFAIEENLLFFIDRDLLNLYSDKDYFEDISKKADALGTPDEEIYKNPMGTEIGISLKGNKYLEELGVRTDELYACFKLSSLAGSDEYTALRSASETMLDSIIEKGK